MIQKSLRGRCRAASINQQRHAAPAAVPRCETSEGPSCEGSIHELRRFAVAAVLAVLALIAGCGGAAGPDAGPGAADGDSTPLVERDVAVPMRDGVILRADVYRPGVPGAFPVLVYRTPYGKAAAAESYETHLEAVARGYAVVLQDVRGRYASDGEFNPYRNEGEDGYDTIEWAAAQSWSNGVVGTYGLSYPGAVQWLAALESPPHLEAMAPAMTFSSPRNFFYMNGIFDLSWLPWIYVNIAPDTRDRLDLPGIRRIAEARAAWPELAQAYRSWLPLAGLPHLRDVAPYYYEWLRHPPEDPWWDWAEVRGRYDRVDSAVLNLSGWFDEAYGPEGAVTNFNGLLATRQGEDANAHLVLGPWTHGVAATESRETGALDFGPAAAIDYDDLVLDFFDHYLGGADNRFAAGPAVRYFVMGANHWEKAPSWPPADARDAPLYLARAELRREAPLPEAPSLSSFVADPERPVVDPHAAFGPRDYQVLAAREDVLTFDSAPLPGGLTVAGAIEAVVYASCDCRDFDLWVRVLDVYPDGRAINLMAPGSDMLRASYRDPAAGRRLLTPERVYELRLPNLITSNRFAAGHRVRIQVSASFAPHFSRNLQTGESEITSSESRSARITLHHSPDYPSRILLPATAEKVPKAVFIIADGIPADVLERTATPELDEISAEGGYTRAFVGGIAGTASESPTVSAVGYHSLLTGTWSNKHNVWSNSIKDPNYDHWDIFRIAKAHDPTLETALFSTWVDNRIKLLGDGLAAAGGAKLDYHVDGFELDTERFPHDENGDYLQDIDAIVAAEAARYIRQEGPDLSWIYLEHTDSVGHRFGDGPEMSAAVRIMDKRIGAIWKAIKQRRKRHDEDWLLLVTTDHGRDAATGKDHGGQSARERMIWIATNSKRLNSRFDRTPGIVDVMPSIAAHLGLDMPESIRRQLDGRSFIATPAGARQ